LGALVGYCSRISRIDLQTAISAWGGPEVGMSGACAAQLAHRLGFPCDGCGLSCTSRLLDPQFGYERLANAPIPALAGVDILSGVGNGGGLAGVIDQARARAKEILASHHVEPPPEDVSRHLDEILAQARRELAARR
jgi:trimethylamine:corrinoid methyltransferase-like protein